MTVETFFIDGIITTTWLLYHARHRAARDGAFKSSAASPRMGQPAAMTDYTMKKLSRTVPAAVMALCLTVCLLCVSVFADNETAQPAASPAEAGAVLTVGESEQPAEEIDIPDEEVPVAAAPTGTKANAAQQVTGEGDADAVSLVASVIAIAGLGYVVVAGKKHKED